MSLKHLLFELKIFLGSKICSECGSKNIVVHGFENHNMRYSCNDCKAVTYLG